jgi:hypothetical protein
VSSVVYFPLRAALQRPGSRVCGSNLPARRSDQRVGGPWFSTQLGSLDAGAAGRLFWREVQSRAGPSSRKMARPWRPGAVRVGRVSLPRKPGKGSGVLVARHAAAPETPRANEVKKGRRVLGQVGGCVRRPPPKLVTALPQDPVAHTLHPWNRPFDKLPG